jgi:TetR/AcrR family fatty acid metabolism transcriptional regulator
MKSREMSEQILDASERIMSGRGLSVTISEISKEAQVSESVLYSHFKGKEDLLFSIPGRRMKQVLNELSEQLDGIIDPLSKLSKMIWFHLNFNDSHPEYARLLLLECRSNHNFYKHQAYELIRKYAGIMIRILKDGAGSGVFYPGLNMRIVRDMIFGLLDWEILNVLASKEIEKSTEDFDDILAVILPMIGGEHDMTQQKLDKKIRILTAAEAVFAAKGYTQATISEIAKLSDVSEGTIYEYFRNKEDLLISVPKRRFDEHLSTLLEIFEIKSPMRKIRRLIRHHFSLYLSKRNFLKVFLLHIQLNNRFYESELYQMFQDYAKLIDDVVEEGKKEGCFRESINNRVFRNLFFGTFSHVALRWLILGEANKADKMKEIDDIVMLLCRAIISEKWSEQISFKRSWDEYQLLSSYPESGDFELPR